jgi:hypothetical protein
LKFIDIDLTGIPINICGNYGDPIYHPDFINFIKKLKARGPLIKINTNGSYKKQDWWEELTDILTPEDTIVFSVDGTPENFTNYRINADWKSIQTGMTVVSRASCNSVWKYIPFSFNQDDIDAVKTLSYNMGIKNFEIEFSDRFDEQTQHLIPNTSLLGSFYSIQSTWKSTTDQLPIDPKCHNGQEHFITADGFYSPCCWLADHRFYYKTLFGKNKKQYDINQHTLTEVLQRPNTVEFFQTLEEQSGCQYNCPKIDG